ncbi:hypothetical protein [Bacteroides sp.]|uniref:hypothetical protein n=1 Tax=Bacteroides sp. TaxID=29523 RepID=UPI00261E7F4D|nr:hypothetical protein [Bacteroides sp.]MDD3039634.1 hypothetical protein [Bacteroides sp.]
MTRLQKESVALMTLRIREMEQLEERIVKDEARMDEICQLLVKCDLLTHSSRTDDLIQEWHNLNSRAEQSRDKLARLRAPSEMTEEDKKLQGKENKIRDRFNINY